MPLITSIKSLCFVFFIFPTVLISSAIAAELPIDPAVKEVNIDASTFMRGDAAPNWVDKLDIPSTQKRNPVVIRLADTQFYAGAIKQVYVNRVIQINDNASLTQAGQIPIYFNPAYEKLHLHAVRIYRGSQVLDQTSSINVRFLQREQALESGVYSGTITAMLLVSDLRVGDSIQYTYSTDGANPVFGSKFNDMASWDQADPVELRRVTVNYPSNRNINWRMVGDFQSVNITPQISVTNGIKKLRFEAKNLKGIDFEEYTPAYYNPLRILHFSEYSSWQDVASWANSLFPKPATLPPELQNLLANARKLANDEARTLYLLQWVQSEIRYFSLSLGESSHRPYAPSEVVARRFGDCKDKTYLLVTLLRELDIEANPVLLSAQTRKISDQYLPDPTLFDHAIVMAKVNKQNYYLDGTKLPQTGQLNLIETGLEGANTLVVNSKTTGFNVIVHPNIKALRTEKIDEHISLKTLDGDAALVSTYTWHGYSAESARVIFGQLTPEQLDKYALSRYERRYPDIVLSKPPQLLDDKKQNVYSIVAHYTVPKIATESSGDWVVHYKPSMLEGVLQVPNTLKRNAPVAVPNYPYQGEYTLNMDWPENVSATFDPFTDQVASPYFKTEFTHNFRGNHQKIAVRFTTLAGEVKVNDLPQFVKDINSLDKLISGLVIANHAFIQTAESTVKKNLAETLKAKEQERIIKYTRAIDSGKLSGDDLANVYCERAFALSNIEQWAKGLTDAEAAMKISPNLANIVACRGELALANNQYAQSLKDLNEALSLGENPNDIYHMRGRLKFYQGKFAAAADDYAKIETSGNQNTYAMLRQVIMLQKTKAAIPDKISKIAQENSLGDWPKPALAMLAGHITPEQVLAEIGKKSGDEKELTLAEAWFYIGEYYLNHGKQDLAVSAFKKTREKNITMYEEHLMAGHELKLLGTKP